MRRFLTALLLLSACDDESVNKVETTPDYIVFGHFYGECGGEQCIEIFKLTEDQLSEDSNDTYPSSDHIYNGSFHTLDAQKFDLVKDLSNHIPHELLSLSENVIGQPDAGDWGGIYFEISSNGEQQYWLIDKMEGNIPEYLRPFVEEIVNSIAEINN